MNQPNSKFILVAGTEADPDVARAVGIAAAHGLRVVFRPLDDERERPAVVAPDAAMQDAATFDALSFLAGRSGQPLRAASERPAVSLTVARGRGFSDAEIRNTLYPYLGQAVQLSQEAVAAAERALEQAREDLRMAELQSQAPLEAMAEPLPVEEPASTPSGG